MKSLPSARGFTLLEVLVTLAIVALLIAVLLEGWFQALRSQERVADAAAAIERNQAIGMLLRQTVAEAVLPDADRGTRFEGDAAAMRFETTASLAPPLGAAPAALALRFEPAGEITRLAARLDGEPARAEYPWSIESAEIAYLDARGEWHPTWPPRRGLVDADPDAFALPSLVRVTLRFPREPRPLVVLAAPRAAGWQIPDPAPPFSGTVEPQ